MAAKTEIEQIVAKAVSQVLEGRVPQLRDELVRCVLEGLPAQLEQSAPASSDEGTSAELLKAITAIHAGTTQREILRALLDNTVRYSRRAALFVVKAASATGWEGRGFESNDDVKNFALDANAGVPSRALQSRMVYSGSPAEMDPQFVSQFGAPADGKILVLPLLLKDKVAALVYADAGVTAGGKMDVTALEVLVTSSSAWLEVASLRKQTQKEGVPETGIAERAEAAAPPVQKVSAFSDPFAGHAPTHTAPAPAEAPVAAAGAATAMAAAAPAPAAEEVEPGSEALPQMSPEDTEIHRKAQRFARLLVDEIKLYNQAKVSEGRKNKDLYDRLKEEIEKSRATFQKRYGKTAAVGADYFSHELVRSLAEDDGSLMGANFRR